MKASFMFAGWCIGAGALVLSVDPVFRPGWDGIIGCVLVVWAFSQAGYLIARGIKS